MDTAHTAPVASPSPQIGRAARVAATQAKMAALADRRAAERAAAREAVARKNTTQYTPPVDTEMAAAAVALAGNGR